ncbi:hypothetical protein ACLOJK_012673 [Asimina triloba]
MIMIMRDRAADHEIVFISQFFQSVSGSLSKVAYTSSQPRSDSDSDDRDRDRDRVGFLDVLLRRCHPAPDRLLIVLPTWQKQVVGPRGVGEPFLDTEVEGHNWHSWPGTQTFESKSIAR